MIVPNLGRHVMEPEGLHGQMWNGIFPVGHTPGDVWTCVVERLESLVAHTRLTKSVHCCDGKGLPVCEF